MNQPHKWWIGDQITLLVANKHVLAQGNTRAYVERQPVNELKKKEDKNKKKTKINKQTIYENKKKQKKQPNY